MTFLKTFFIAMIGFVCLNPLQAKEVKSTLMDNSISLDEKTGAFGSLTVNLKGEGERLKGYNGGVRLGAVTSLPYDISVKMPVKAKLSKTNTDKLAEAQDVLSAGLELRGMFRSFGLGVKGAFESNDDAIAFVRNTKDENIYGAGIFGDYELPVVDGRVELGFTGSKEATSSTEISGYLSLAKVKYSFEDLFLGSDLNLKANAKGGSTLYDGSEKGFAAVVKDGIRADVKFGASLSKDFFDQMVNLELPIASEVNYSKANGINAKVLVPFMATVSYGLFENLDFNLKTGIKANVLNKEGDKDIAYLTEIDFVANGSFTYSL